MPLKECCANEDNLSAPEISEDTVDGNTYRVCAVCSCKHYRAVIDPFHIGIIPAST